MKNRALSLVLAMVLSLGCFNSFSATASKQPSVYNQINLITKDRSFTQDMDSVATIKSYLKTYFNVDSINDKMDYAAFIKALNAVSGAKLKAGNTKLTFDSVIKSAVIAANYEELALSYTQTKVEDRLAYYKIKKTNNSQYLLAALDAGLIDLDIAKGAISSANISSEDITYILMNVANATGNARNYLTYSNDPQIYSRLQNQWNSFVLLDNAKLMNVGNKSVENKITTGFNVKKDSYNARFLPSLTLQYGHSDIKHAHQLMALLNSEGIIAKVQLEPKVSAFEYLLDWGPVPKATPTYEVKQVKEDLYIAYAVEYDLMLEFENKEQLQKFDSVIKAYAKKNDGNEEAKGLIYESWWQPLYSNTVQINKTDYHLIYDAVIKNDGYSLHPFCLPENLDKVKSELEKIDKSLKVEPVARYCNTAFLNYMTGEDHQ